MFTFKFSPATFRRITTFFINILLLAARGPKKNLLLSRKNASKKKTFFWKTKYKKKKSFFIATMADKWPGPLLKYFSYITITEIQPNHLFFNGCIMCPSNNLAKFSPKNIIYLFEVILHEEE